MARSRNIKPGFFTNDLLAELEPLARLLFIGLWCHADREGRMHDRPKKIKAEILPYDDCDADKLLNDLMLLGFIIRYDSDGSRLIQVQNFTKHQNPHIKEPASEIPAPCQHSTSTVQESDKNSSGPADSLNLIPDPGFLIPDSPTPKPGAPAPKKARNEYPPEFEEAWNAYPNRPGASKAESHKAWKARVNAGADPQTILSGVRRYADYCTALGTDPNFIKQPATFFGPGEHYLSDWAVAARPSAPVGGKSEKFDPVRYVNDRSYADEVDRRRSTGKEGGGNGNVIDGQAERVA